MLIRLTRKRFCNKSTLAKKEWKRKFWGYIFNLEGKQIKEKRTIKKYLQRDLCSTALEQEGKVEEQPLKNSQKNTKAVFRVQKNAICLRRAD